MQILLLHNPSAGTEHPSADDLVAILRDAGHSVSYRSAKEPDLQDALRGPYDLVVAAGGDGTVTKIATNLPDRRIPMTILPIGTANNLARALGIGGTPRDLVAGWPNGRLRPLDVGVADTPQGRFRFIEGVGLGSLAQAMEEISAADLPSNDRFQRSRDAFCDVLTRTEPQRVSITVDGQPLPGNLLLVEVMNIGFVGPNLPLAPSADPGDGLLDVVFVQAHQRVAMLDWVNMSEKEKPPPVQVRQGRLISIAWQGTEVRLGDDFSTAPDEGGTTTIQLEPDPLQVLVPSAAGNAGQPEINAMDRREK